jgi:hypothetical protein
MASGTIQIVDESASAESGAPNVASVEGGVASNPVEESWLDDTSAMASCVATTASELVSAIPVSGTFSTGASE